MNLSQDMYDWMSIRQSTLHHIIETLYAVCGDTDMESTQMPEQTKITTLAKFGLSSVSYIFFDTGSLISPIKCGMRKAERIRITQ